MDRARVDPEGPGGDVSVGLALALYEEQTIGIGTAEHSLSGLHEAAGVHADPVAHLHGLDGDHFDLLQLHGLAYGEQIPELADGEGVLGLDDHSVHSLLHGGEVQLGLLLPARYCQNLSAGGPELGDHVLQGDDGPVGGLHDDGLLLSHEVQDLLLVGGGVDLRELDVVGDGLPLLEVDDLVHLAEVLEGLVPLAEDEVDDSGLQSVGDQVLAVVLVCGQVRPYEDLLSVHVHSFRNLAASSTV